MKGLLVIDNHRHSYTFMPFDLSNKARLGRDSRNGKALVSMNGVQGLHSFGCNLMQYLGELKIKTSLWHKDQSECVRWAMPTTAHFAL
jgi:hypothetical protein